ncbi:MAG: hypothetical protein V5B34_00960 [Accumulibacter sp.]|jgi:hypothetical protein
MSDTPSQKTEQRRKLLKKAAAAPAILLLPSTGRATANSSLHACVDKGLLRYGEPQEKYLPGADPQNPPYDVWVRQYRAGDKPGSYLVLSDTNTPVAHASCWNSITPKGGPQANANNLIP